MQGAIETGVVSDWKQLLLGLLDVIKGARGMAKKCAATMDSLTTHTTSTTSTTPTTMKEEEERELRIGNLKETQKSIILAAGQMVTNVSGFISVTKALNENRFAGNMNAIANANGVCKSKAQAIMTSILTFLSTLKQLL